MINWENFDKAIKIDVDLVAKLIPGLKAEIKYETSKGLKNVSKEDLRKMKDFRNFAISQNLFSLSHPILEDDLNLLTELEGL